MSEKPKKKRYEQRFREEWLTDPDLSPWLKEVPMKKGGSGAECTFCGVYITMKHGDLVRHSKTTKHINNSIGKKILSPSERALATKPHKGQLLNITKPVTEENGVNYSVHQVKPCEFVVLKNELPSEESSRTTSLNNSRVSKEFDEFEDLMKFDDTSSFIPYSYLEEKYFEFHNIIDKNKFRYRCKLCKSIKFVRATRKSSYALKSHIRHLHWDHYDEFLECMRTNSRLGRPKRIKNPFPYSKKYFKFLKANSTRATFECKLCPTVNTFSDVRTVKCPRKNPYNLEKHIRKHHNSHAEEFRNCVNDYAKSLLNQTESSKQSDQSSATPEKDEDSEKCKGSSSTENQLTTGTKIKLPQTRRKKINIPQMSDDDDLFDDDDRDPDFEPQSPGSPDTDIDVEGSYTAPQSPASPEPQSREISVFRNRLDPSDLTTKRDFAIPPVFQPPKNHELDHFVPLFDNVLVQKDETFTPVLMKDGLIIPPTYKAKVVAVGRGIRSDSGKMIPLEVSVGDGVIIPESGGAVMELDGKEYLLYKDSDLLAKFKL